MTSTIRIGCGAGFAGDRLEPALGAFGQDLHAESLAALPRETHRFGPARRKRIHARIPDARFVERLEPAIVDGFVVNQCIDRLA